MDIENRVKKIIADVRHNGDSAIVKYTKKYDNLELSPKEFKIGATELEIAALRLKESNRNLHYALKEAALNITEYHKKQSKRIAKKLMFRRKGLIAGEILTPINNVAAYIPGGRYSYPSSVLMCVLPAKVAGSKNISVFTPPKNATDIVLAAAYLAGADNFFRIGGAQAIAAAAYGTKTIHKSDLIVGPGNVYVTEAKRQLFGTVGIDMLAGPSEVVIIADESVPSGIIAEDLLAQAEHDPRSKAFVFARHSSQLAEIKKIIPTFYRKQIVFKKCVIEEAVKIANEIAPEHIEILTRNAEKVARGIQNAGAIFIGKYTPTALGDYFAGPSHVLPTASSARFSSGLSVMSFLKRSSIINSTRKGLKHWIKHVEIFAQAEGLKHHSSSASVRRGKPRQFQDEKQQ